MAPRLLKMLLTLSAGILYCSSWKRFQSSYQDDEEGVPFDGQAGSFPKEFGYGPFDNEQDSNPADHKPRILLMGLRR